MMLSKKKMAVIGVMLSLAGGVAGQAMAQDARDVVKDVRGNVVVNTFGNCVRTKWDSGMDACGTAAMAAAPAVAAPAQDTARQLQTEDRVIYFDFDSAALTPASHQKIDYLARMLRSSKEVTRANIVGYADRIGKGTYNQKLSERRAAVVRDALIAQGFVNTRVMDVRALGASSSVSKCEGITARQNLIDCLWRDRRVEVELEYVK